MTSKFRESRGDIQALRGFAVLVVMLYHAKLSIIPGGYLGVDVFFVISGFLITRLIKDSIDSGGFVFSEFYLRRARRLLPAAYVVFLITAALAPFMLTESGLSDFRDQLIGAVTFTSNMVLWKQSGYFEGAAELKPLLHTWSLAIEEQFYLFLPAVLVLTPKRFHLKGVVVLFVISISFCFLMMQARPLAAFYLLPTRGWELIIGSIGAIIFCGDRLRLAIRLLFWPALILLVFLPAAPFGLHHPGLDAFLICMSTLVVILRRHKLLLKSIVIRFLGRSGDISYSLYLVHWPLLAFFNNIWLGESDSDVATMARLALVALSFPLACLLNRYVEEPFRALNTDVIKRLLPRALLFSFALVVLAISIPVMFKEGREYSSIFRVNQGLSATCEFVGEFYPFQECVTSNSPDVLIWGDSYAMHLVPGIVAGAVDSPSIAQATRSVCGPLLDIGYLSPSSGYTKEWAKSCVEFNDSVLRYLKRTESISVVVLSSPFGQYLGVDNSLLKRNSSDGSYGVVMANQDEAIRSLKKTVDVIRSMGKKVVVIAPPPSNKYNTAICLERLGEKLPILGVESGCEINKFTYEKVSYRVLDYLAALPARADVDVISFDSYLCNNETCRTQIDGVFIYRDAGHLSVEGSIYLSKELSLVAKIFQMSR